MRDLLRLMCLAKEPAQIRRTAIGAHDLDGGAAEQVIDIPVVDIFYDRTAHQNRVVVEIPDRPDDLVFLFVEDGLQAEPRFMEMIKGIQKKDQKPQDKQDRKGRQLHTPQKHAPRHYLLFRCLCLILHHQ